MIYRNILIFLSLYLLPASMQAQLENFRFAQLTDLHLSPDNPEPTEDLLRSVAQLNATDSIDFVLVTGDLTEAGDQSTMQHVKSCLDLLKMPYYVVSGNHETKWSESGYTAFEKVFGQERFEFEHKGILFIGFNSGPLMRMAYGHVAPQDIRWMTQKMDEWGKEKPVILVTHYPIQKGDVDNWYEVTDAVRPYNIRLFVGGHYHKNCNLRYDGIPGILMESNLRDKEDKQSYGIYEVTADSILIYTQRVGEDKQKWAAFSMKDNYYDREGKAENYPDFSINEKYPQVKKDWILQTGSGIYCSPAVDGNLIFIGDDTGKLTAYTLSKGEKLWSFACGKRIVGTPATADGVVVTGSADGCIYGIQTNNGKLLWKVETSAPVLGAASIEHGMVYIGGSDHSFRKIDIHTGEVKWIYSQVQGYIETKPLITDGKVIFGAWDNILYALDTFTGKEVWKWTHGLPGIHYSPAAVWPVATDNRVFIADPKRALTAIDLQTGETIWRTFQSQVRESIGIAEDASRIYAKTMNDSIVCYSPTCNQPQQLWRSNIGFGYEHAPTMQIEKKGTVIGSTKEGVIFGLDAQTGRICWQHKIGNSLINTVTVTDDQRVVFSATSGEVGVLKFK